MKYRWNSGQYGMFASPEEQSEVTDCGNANACCHYWMIQTADGPVSLGVCKHCLESREFKNSIEDWSFDQTLQAPAALY